MSTHETQVNYDDTVRQLVVARLATFPNDRGISVGSYGEFSRDELIKHVLDGDEIGDTMVEMDLEYLRMLKKDGFFEHLAGNTT